MDNSFQKVLLGRKAGIAMNLIWTALLMGFMGGFHCIGMCGPIAMALPGQPNDRGAYISGRVFYNLGRIVTYAVLGFAIGIFGFTFNMAGWQQGLSIVSGLLILALQFVPGNPSGKVARTLRLSILINRIKKTFSQLLHKKGILALFVIGLLNGILPCGFVYLALVAAMATGTVEGAAFYMVLFGLGTFPIMLILSLSGKMISFRMRNKIQKAVPYIVVFIALLFILRGLSLGIPYLSPKIMKAEPEMTICH